MLSSRYRKGTTTNSTVIYSTSTSINQIQTRSKKFPGIKDCIFKCSLVEAEKEEPEWFVCPVNIVKPSVG